MELGYEVLCQTGQLCSTLNIAHEIIQAQRCLKRQLLSHLFLTIAYILWNSFTSMTYILHTEGSFVQVPTSCAFRCEGHVVSYSLPAAKVCLVFWALLFAQELTRQCHLMCVDFLCALECHPAHTHSRPSSLYWDSLQSVLPPYGRKVVYLLQDVGS